MASSRPSSPALTGSVSQDKEGLPVNQPRPCNGPLCQAWHQTQEKAMLTDINKFERGCAMLRGKYDKSKLMVKELETAYKKLQSDHEALKVQKDEYLFRIQELDQSDRELSQLAADANENARNALQALEQIPVLQRENEKLKEDLDRQRKLTEEHQKRNEMQRLSAVQTQQAKIKLDAENGHKIVQQTVSNTENAINCLAKYGKEYLGGLSEFVDGVSEVVSKQEAVQTLMLNSLKNRFEECEKAFTAAGHGNVQDELNGLFEGVEVHFDMTRTGFKLIRLKNDDCYDAVEKAKQGFDEDVKNFQVGHELTAVKDTRINDPASQPASKATADTPKPTGASTAQPGHNTSYRDALKVARPVSKPAERSAPSQQKTTWKSRTVSSRVEPKAASTKGAIQPRQPATSEANAEEVTLRPAASLVRQDTAPDVKGLGAVTRVELDTDKKGASPIRVALPEDRPQVPSATSAPQVRLQPQSTTEVEASSVASPAEPTQHATSRYAPAQATGPPDIQRTATASTQNDKQPTAAQHLQPSLVIRSAPVPSNNQVIARNRGTGQAGSTSQGRGRGQWRIRGAGLGLQNALTPMGSFSHPGVAASKFATGSQPPATATDDSEASPQTDKLGNQEPEGSKFVSKKIHRASKKRKREDGERGGG